MAGGNSTFKTVVLNKRPENEITDDTFKFVEKPALTEADLQDGQVLIEVLYLSLDPAMRGWLNGESI